jgi:hypothetical protein
MGMIDYEAFMIGFLLAITIFFLIKTINKVQDRLISVVMDVHEESRFYHNAGRSSAQHQLEIERMNIERIQAEADKAKAEAALMGEERIKSREFSGSRDPNHGVRGHKRTVIKSIGGPNE